MRLARLAACACACGAPSHPAVPGPRDYATQLESARDVVDVRRILRDSVTNGGLWFPDAECTREFGEPGQITGGRVDAFAACLVSLHLRASARRDELLDVAVLTYAPGFEVEGRFLEDRDRVGISWIGYSARLENETLPTVSAVALEELRIDGDRDGPIAADRLGPAATALAWLKICVDAAGAVSDVSIRQMTSKRGATAFAVAARGWHFKPFVVAEQPTPVCAMFEMKYPPVRAPAERERLPIPLTMTSGVPLVPQQQLHRVAGERAITPDDVTRTLIQKAGLAKLVGSFKICLDETGHPTDVVLLRSTRSTMYDQKIVRTIKTTWVYAPAIIDGAPTAVCTAVTFIYSQR